MEERKGREEKIRFQRSCEFFFSLKKVLLFLSLFWLLSLLSRKKKQVFESCFKSFRNLRKTPHTLVVVKQRFQKLFTFERERKCSCVAQLLEILLTH